MKNMKNRILLAIGGVFLLLAFAVSVPVAAAEPDLADGDIFVGAAEGFSPFWGVLGPRIVWQVRNGVARRYCEGSAAADDRFFALPAQMIVDSRGRVVFLAQLGSEYFVSDVGLFRCDGMGSTPEKLAVFKRGTGPARAGFPDPFPGKAFHAISGLHLATVQTIGINAESQRLTTEDAYVMAMQEIDPSTGLEVEVKVRRYRATTGQWDVAPIDATRDPSHQGMPVMTNHGGATYSSVHSTLRRSTDPLRLDVEGSIGSVDFELHAALFGGFKQVYRLIVDDSAVPNTSSGCDPDLPQPPSLMEPGPGLYSSMTSYNYDIAYDGHGNLGLVLRTNSGGGGSPYLANVSEVLLNDNPNDDIGDYFYRSTTGCLPEASLKYTSIVPFFHPVTGASNGIRLGSMAVSAEGLVGTVDDRLVRVIAGEGLQTIASGFVLPFSWGPVATYPAMVPPASGAVVVIQINSPVDVLVTDAAGNRIGVDPATGLPVNDFGQNGYDSGPGEPRFLAIKNPTPGAFDVDAVGAGDGPYSITVYSAPLGKPEVELNKITVSGTVSLGSVEEHDFTLEADTTIAFDVTPPILTPRAHSNGSSSYFSEGGYNAYATFDVKYEAGASTPSGPLTFSSSKTRRKIASTGIASLSVTGKTAVITGPCTLNGVAGYSFTATVGDNATPGAGADTFAITVTGPSGFTYTASGTIKSGDYTVSQ